LTIEIDEIKKIVKGYGKEISIGVIGSHSALDIFGHL